MKKITALFFSLLVTMAALGQKSNQSDGLLDGYFGVGTGLCMPVGNFGSNSRVNPNAYSATQGANFEMNYMARFSKHFGMAVTARSITMGHNVTSTAGYFNGNDPNYLWSAEATPDKIKTAMMGLFTMVPLDKTNNLMLFFKPMLGASFVSPSETTYNLIAKTPGYRDGSVQVSSGGQAFAFAYSFALGIKADITPLFAFTAQIDYMSTKPMFNAQSVNSTTYRTYSQDITPYYLRMQMLSVNIGVALKVN